MTTLRQLKEDIQALKESASVPETDALKSHIASHGKSHLNPYTLDAEPRKMKQGGHTTTITRVKFAQNPTEKEFSDAESALKNKFGDTHRLHTNQPITATSAWGD